MEFTTHDGKKVIDGISSLWCVGAGHNRKPINEAIKKQLDTLDYATAFQASNDQAFKAAEMIAAMAPGDLNKVLFCNSGSRSRRHVDEGRAGLPPRARRRPPQRLHRPREGLPRRRLRRHVAWAASRPTARCSARRLLPRVDHLRFIHDPANHAYIHNQEPVWAEDSAGSSWNSRILPLHDPSNVAAIIVEPVAGSRRLVPAAQGLPASACARSATSTASC